MNPLTYIHDESVRQSAHVTEMAGMCEAYRALTMYHGPLDENLIKNISFSITRNSDYRRVPAVFNQGRPAVNAELISKLMGNLVKAINLDAKEGFLDEQIIDHYIREFLCIHPFADGNGRVASLLRNYLLGTLNDPTPLPYYFGEN